MLSSSHFHYHVKNNHCEWSVCACLCLCMCVFVSRYVGDSKAFIMIAQERKYSNFKVEVSGGDRSDSKYISKQKHQNLSMDALWKKNNTQNWLDTV